MSFTDEQNRYIKFREKKTKFARDYYKKYKSVFEYAEYRRSFVKITQCKQSIKYHEERVRLLIDRMVELQKRHTTLRDRWFRKKNELKSSKSNVKKIRS